MARNKDSYKFKVLKGGQAEPGLEAAPDPVTSRWNSPSWLGEHGRGFHKRYWPMVKSMGLITEADRESWFNLCQRWHRIRQLESEIDEHGHVVKGRGSELKRNPAASMLKNELENFRRERSQFGLDPQSRERLGVRLPSGPKTVMQQLVDW